MRLISLAILILSAAGNGEADRYELGRRLHEFEVTWDKHADDTAAKKRRRRSSRKPSNSTFSRLSSRGSQSGCGPACSRIGRARLSADPLGGFAAGRSEEPRCRCVGRGFVDYA